MKKIIVNPIAMFSIFLILTILSCKSTDKKINEKQPNKNDKLASQNSEKLGKYKEQIELLKQRIEADPRDVNAFAQLGYLYGQLGDIREEISYYEKAVTIFPQFKEVYYNLACAYSDLGEKDKSIHALESALKNGFRSQSLIESDKDLRALQNEDRYKELIKKYFFDKNPDKK